MRRQLLFVSFLVTMETSNRYHYLLIIKEGWIKPIFSLQFTWGVGSHIDYRLRHHLYENVLIWVVRLYNFHSSKFESKYVRASPQCHENAVRSIVVCGRNVLSATSGIVVYYLQWVDHVDPVGIYASEAKIHEARTLALKWWSVVSSTFWGC